MSTTLEAYATLAFIVIFGGIIAWAYWPSNRKKFEKDGRIPFDNDKDR